jgi:hypothetical protein
MKKVVLVFWIAAFAVAAYTTLAGAADLKVTPKMAPMCGPMCHVKCTEQRLVCLKNCGMPLKRACITACSDEYRACKAKG